MGNCGSKARLIMLNDDCYSQPISLFRMHSNDAPLVYCVHVCAPLKFPSSRHVERTITVWHSWATHDLPRSQTYHQSKPRVLRLLFLYSRGVIQRLDAHALFRRCRSPTISCFLPRPKSIRPKSTRLRIPPHPRPSSTVHRSGLLIKFTSIKRRRRAPHIF